MSRIFHSEASVIEKCERDKKEKSFENESPPAVPDRKEGGSGNRSGFVFLKP